MGKIKVQIQYKDGKYPYFFDRDLNITGIGSRNKGRVIYTSGKLVKEENGKSYIEFEQISPIAVKLQNVRMMVTQSGTLVIKSEESSTLYVVEIPSGYRGDVTIEILNGECEKTNILMSPAGSLGEVVHLWCNGNTEILYNISGRTRTAGFGELKNLFGENLSGRIVMKDGNIKVIYDEELDKLLDGSWKKNKRDRKWLWN